MTKKIVYGLLSLSPMLAFAQTEPDLGGVESLVKQIGDIIELLIPIFFAIAIIYFFWGLATYIRSAGDPAAAAKGKSIMIYGIIAIAIMASIYGIVAWLQGTLGVEGTGTVELPEIPGLGN